MGENCLAMFIISNVFVNVVTGNQLGFTAMLSRDGNRCMANNGCIVGEAGDFHSHVRIDCG